MPYQRPAAQQFSSPCGQSMVIDQQYAQSQTLICYSVSASLPGDGKYWHDGAPPGSLSMVSSPGAFRAFAHYGSPMCCPAALPDRAMPVILDQ
jgi:hypothetical protein